MGIKYNKSLNSGSSLETAELKEKLVRTSVLRIGVCSYGNKMITHPTLMQNYSSLILIIDPPY